jgi:enoyl-CoA hydratase/carnithine racemase
LGPGLSTRLLQLSETVKAPELVPSGFIAELIPGDILSTVIAKLEEKLPTLSQSSIEANKAQIRDAETRKKLHAVNDGELAVLATRYGHPDAVEAIRRFKAEQEAKKKKKAGERQAKL